MRGNRTTLQRKVLTSKACLKMAPPHTGTHAYHSRYERSQAIALLSDLGRSSPQIAEELGVSRSTVWSVVKRYHTQGYIGDAKRSGMKGQKILFPGLYK